MEETLNALVLSTFLGVSDQGVLTMHLKLKCLEDQIVRFGNVALETVTGGQLQYTSLTNRLVSRILLLLERQSWEDLPSTPVRIKVQGGRISMLGHFTKERWLNLDDEIAAFQQETCPIPESNPEEEVGASEEVRSDSPDVSERDEGHDENVPRARTRRSTSRSKQKDNSD